MSDWKPINTEPQDGSPIWMCEMIGGKPHHITPAISNTLPTTWPTHWKPRAEEQREYKE